MGPPNTDSVFRLSATGVVKHCSECQTVNFREWLYGSSINGNEIAAWKPPCFRVSADMGKVYKDPEALNVKCAVVGYSEMFFLKCCKKYFFPHF